MERIEAGSLESVRHALAWHAQKIIALQDKEGMISSYTVWNGGKIERKKDVVRQSMATMGLMFAQTLDPSLHIEKEIEASLAYIEKNIEQESPMQQLYVRLYLALAQVYTGKDATRALELVRAHVNVPEFLGHPIAAGLYLRLSLHVPNLPHVPYLQEIQRYNVSLVPRKGRFFDYADTLVWAKRVAPELALQEYQYLEKCYTTDGWFKDPQTKARAWSSVVGKFFEVLALYGADMNLTERIYARLMQERATSQYAKDTLGAYGEHILSQPHTLSIDDAHFHVLVGLCYLLEAHQKNL